MILGVRLTLLLNGLGSGFEVCSRGGDGLVKWLRETEIDDLNDTVLADQPRGIAVGTPSGVVVGGLKVDGLELGDLD